MVHLIDCAFPDETPDRVAVAVSGGGDSMALLDLAIGWSRMAGRGIEAVTVDHGLRPEAAQEAAQVGAFCADRGVPHTVLNWDGAGARGNIAAAGRAARYDLIAKWAKLRGIGHVLLGHTADDIAETFLMRLARKSGVDGLAMMAPRFTRNGIHWARPLWQQGRGALRDYLCRQNVAWIEDPTNEDLTHERPKARQILGALSPLGIGVETLRDVAMAQSSARSALVHYTAQDAARTVQEQAGDVVIADQGDPLIHTEIQRRLRVAALQYVGRGPYPVRSDALVEMDAGLARSGRHTLAGCLITQEPMGLRIAREYNAVASLEVPLGELWDGRWQITGPGDGHGRIRALGPAIREVPHWRDTGLTRDTLMVTPAVFEGETLIAAPVAGLQNGFQARIVADFASFLLSR